MAGNRTIIGSENSDDRHVELDKAVQNNKLLFPWRYMMDRVIRLNVAFGVSAKRLYFHVIVL